jgi:hypothetical protein
MESRADCEEQLSKSALKIVKCSLPCFAFFAAACEVRGGIK